ncbi:hypothetical protein RHGRI_013529 [Rhododendron griersonianum]|uniref:Ribosomal protein S4 n=1 Tax=Rhododendron griersonianum TaxID=479676 RepID=A0AAV6K684_9ERIC|nr:hypothetical protein RHGRI_013529 [Rhododendron griersonianum]
MRMRWVCAVVVSHANAMGSTGNPGSQEAFGVGFDSCCEISIQLLVLGFARLSNEPPPVDCEIDTRTNRSIMPDRAIKKYVHTCLCLYPYGNRVRGRFIVDRTVYSKWKLCNGDLIRKRENVVKIFYGRAQNCQKIARRGSGTTLLLGTPRAKVYRLAATGSTHFGISLVPVPPISLVPLYHPENLGFFLASSFGLW